MKLIEWIYYRKDFLTSQGFSATFVDRFWDKVQISQECWLWIAATRGGYGSFGYGPKGKTIGAHVASWIIHFGPVPPGQLVCHTCDNPPCVNPTHLFLGSDADNARDRMVKGRSAVGEDHGRSKVTQRQIFFIKSEWTGGRSQSSIAREVGLDRSQISRIVHGHSWKHI